MPREGAPPSVHIAPPLVHIAPPLVHIRAPPLTHASTAGSRVGLQLSVGHRVQLRPQLIRTLYISKPHIYGVYKRGAGIYMLARRDPYTVQKALHNTPLPGVPLEPPPRARCHSCQRRWLPLAAPGLKRDLAGTVGAHLPCSRSSSHLRSGRLPPSATTLKPR